MVWFFRKNGNFSNDLDLLCSYEKNEIHRSIQRRKIKKNQQVSYKKNEPWFSLSLAFTVKMPHVYIVDSKFWMNWLKM